MIFTSLFYPIFLLVAVAVFHLLPKDKRAIWVTVCGLSFYMFYAGGFLLVIAAEAILVYLLARRSQRLGIFAVALTGIVGLLAYFKYRIMFYNLLFAPFGNGPISAEHIIIPLALSFYTFEFIHYLVDARRGTLQDHTFTEFMAFAVFFPTMVAGPIKRFQDFTPKLRNAALSWGLISAGLLRIVVGLAKKIVIADSMNTFVDPLTSGSSHVEAGVLATGLIAYSIKIYMDFSGYSDIAIGSAALFGIKVPENFSFPYLKSSIASFWKHWHISLTRWIIDYVFIPLGGSKRGLALALTNTLIAMGVSGLWHGAAPNFIAWGLYHGILLGLYRLYREYIKPRVFIPAAITPITRSSSVLFTYSLVTVGWGFFIMPAGRYLAMVSNTATAIITGVVK